MSEGTSEKEEGVFASSRCTSRTRHRIGVCVDCMQRQVQGKRRTGPVRYYYDHYYSCTVDDYCPVLLDPTFLLGMKAAAG